MLQLAAIRGLVEMKPVTVGVVNTLKATLESTTLFCRVRMEAALALASTAGTEYNGAPPPPPTGLSPVGYCDTVEV